MACAQNLVHFNIVHFLETNKIPVAAIQETKFYDEVTCKAPPGYSMKNKNRYQEKGKVGAFAVLIKHNVKNQELKIPMNHQDPHIENCGIKILSGENHMNLNNVYIPPPLSCDSGYTASINQLLNFEDSLILGDFNAHNPLWFSEFRGGY